MFAADVLAGQKTGWFFDQRDNRRFVTGIAAGARVLDLYCYSGGFAVRTAHAGAEAVLGIDVPGWLRTEITRSGDPLTASYEQCVVNARALIAFCRRLSLPFGVNVESLTNRKIEIDASIDLVREIRNLLG